MSCTVQHWSDQLVWFMVGLKSCCACLGRWGTPVLAVGGGGASMLEALTGEVGPSIHVVLA